MHQLINDLPTRLKKWIEIDYENGKGLFRSDMYEMAAQEAAASLCDCWDSQFTGLSPSIVAGDVDRVIYQLERWRDELIESLPDEQ